MGLWVEMKPSKAMKIKEFIEELGYGVNFVDRSFMRDKNKIGVHKGDMNLYSNAKNKPQHLPRHEANNKRALNQINGYLHHIKGTYKSDELTDYATVKHILRNLKMTLEKKAEK